MTPVYSQFMVLRPGLDLKKEEKDILKKPTLVETWTDACDSTQIFTAQIVNRRKV